MTPLGESDVAANLVLTLIGVGVRVRTNDADLAARLAICYGASLGNAEEAKDGLDAELERSGERWRVRVEGRAETEASDPVAALRTFNHELMHGVMLGARELYFVHAAVVEIAGRGVVLPGLSQAGKSTLALALLERGARYLSDELLAYDPVHERALGFPRALKIRDECVGYFPDLAADFVGHGEGRFLPFRAHPTALSASTRIAAIVLPRWSGIGCTTELTPLSAGEALLALASSSLNFGAHRTRSLDCLTSLVRTARAWRLLWSDPHDSAARIEEALRAVP